MREKTSLLLMELLVMLLVFSLAAALCLGIFARSHQISQDTLRRENAALLAQNAAELLKNGKDPALLDTGELALSIEPLPSPVPGYLQTAAVVVSFQGEPLFRLEIGWQEVAP